MNHREISHQRSGVAGYRALALDSPNVHHGAKRRERIIDAEVQEMERRRALRRAMEVRRRLRRAEDPFARRSPGEAYIPSGPPSQRLKGR